MMAVIPIKPFKKIMVANRGEIAIRIFRAAAEMGIQTVAIYSTEDRLHLHRYKADEAYLIGVGKTPVGAYLAIDEIVELAVDKGVDAIHPGYGFLSENADFARACRKAGIAFIGPPPEVLDAMGDKVAARLIAERAKVPTVPGTREAVESEQDALLFAKEYGYPLIIKAAMGGGGRGMSIVNDRGELLNAIARSRAEAEASFGNPKVFIERYLDGPKHIEVQVLADQHGNMVHLFERDCSIQRRHQKVVEIAPALNLTAEQKAALYADALAIAREVDYVNAGTVEFLVDSKGQHYFIEVNPRIQVEHTVTEVITGRDIVQCQIRIAEGYPLSHDTIRIPDQAHIKKSGYCIQLRLTTEDPANNFAPDHGKITAFRAGEGMGIRLDAGSGFDGAVITPHYDSLLIKVCSWGLQFDQAANKALRAIREFRIRGVKTNIPFLENVLKHPDFLAGVCTTKFIETHPELFDFKPKLDRANKVLDYLSQVAVNGFPDIDAKLKPARIQVPQIPAVPKAAPPVSPAFAVFKAQGAAGLAKWLTGQKALLLTDTTFRDAHQSLIATRMRGDDLFKISHATAHLASPLFSNEMWGGATFDVALRFLHEDPWERLRRIRRLMPGTLLQMLLRSGNAVGYTNYPDNVVNRFIDASARNGIDIFRIFDCLNWVEGLKPCIEAVVKTGKIAEAAICYSGDITDGKRVKYTLSYYVKLAKELEKAGTHILGIKDMAGLLKPDAARILVTELKNAVSLPIHLHTHDTSGNQVAALLEASKAGVDVVDAALSSMSGITSQPSLNALVYALKGSGRDTGMDEEKLQKLADFWEVAREPYAPFECGLKAGTADVYRHEMPGGQYSNFRAQAISLGLGERWEEVKTMYRTVNDMSGDIIKVTPSSKAVGDMALFMTQNDLTPQDVVTRAKDLAFPDSYVSMMKGMMGQPPGGFPPDVQKAVLKGEEPITCRPGELLEDFDFEAAQNTLKSKFGRYFTEEDLLSYAQYPKVFVDYLRFGDHFGDVSVLDTPTFFYGVKIGEEKAITIQEGKTLIVKLLAIGDLQADGTRTIFWELNGRRRNTVVTDANSGVKVKKRDKADPDNPNHIPAPMAGKVVELAAAAGDKVEEGQKLLTTEAMKMLNVVKSPCAGTVARVLVAKGEDVAPGDLVFEIKPI
ncbi:MAG: pyruvate carboxylase [Fibrobacteres bacterium]|nr:pyruvate carboxylase [Fibrobacterota bacterium]